MQAVEGEVVTPTPKQLRELLLPARRVVRAPTKARPPRKFVPDGQCKLTDEVQDYICDLLGDGSPITVAAAAVGINPRTFYDWMEKGREARRGKYRDFYDAVEIAKARYELHHVRELNRVAVEGETEIHEKVTVNHRGEVTVEIKKVTKRNGRASAAILAARHPERWGEKRQIDQNVTVTDTRPTAVEFHVVPDNGVLEEDQVQDRAAAEAEEIAEPLPD